MKNNYNIKIDPPEISSEQIQKHQDFDALFAQFQEVETAPKEPAVDPKPAAPKAITKITPLLIKYGTGAVIAVAASILVVFMIRQSMMSVDGNLPTEQINELLALNTPLSKDLSKPFDALVVESAEKGETLSYHSGSKIVVPASAFVDEKGMPVEGKVEIQYREFNDHVDMFLAGVPKEMDKHQNLQSAGMMEIKGFQNGKPVYLSMDKTLEVELKGTVMDGISTGDLNVYVYSKQQDAWDYVVEDKVEVLAQQQLPEPTVSSTTEDRAKLEQEVRRTLARSKPTQPIKPGVPNGMQEFDFDINVDQFPELAAYHQKVDLMVKESAISMATFDTIWNSMKMVGLGNNKYRMELTYEGNEGNIVRKFDVYPVVIATQEAERIYQERLEVYQLKLEQWEQDVLAEVEERLNTVSDSLDWAAQTSKKGWKEIINRFKIHRFGLWNCGKIIDLQDSPIIAANFVDANGQNIVVDQLFITNKNKQLYYFAPNNEQNPRLNVKCEAAVENKIWALTKEDELLVATIEASTPLKDQMTFEMEVVGIVDSEEAVRTALTF